MSLVVNVHRHFSNGKPGTLRFCILGIRVVDLLEGRILRCLFTKNFLRGSVRRIHDFFWEGPQFDAILQKLTQGGRVLVVVLSLHRNVGFSCGHLECCLIFLGQLVPLLLIDEELQTG